MQDIVINGRFRKQRMTGIQRVAESITTRLQTPYSILEPGRWVDGVKGHIWEQTILPIRAGSRLLWGPCNVGPVIAPHQILTIHGAGVFDHPEWFSRNFVRLNHTLWPILAKRALKIVTVSYFSQARISEVLNIPKNNIEVIWNGVDESFSPANNVQILAAQKSVGLGNRRYFATLSTLEPRKNLKLVLQAWEIARKLLPNDYALLVIGGKGRSSVFSATGLEDTSVGEGVVFSGYVEEHVLPHLLSGACGVLYPSIYEGFGLPVLEAMACGVPAVTTRLTSLPEVGGDVALYVDPADPSDLARVLVQLASDEAMRKELGIQGIKRASTFGWQVAADKMDDIFRRFG